ncbi:MAG: MarR family winged helix-turn-helix transcriptional regulator [Candidatus Limnocylindria bacterium]
MLEATPRRLSLLYQLYLASQASRRFMKLALAGEGISGEEYALFSYLYANGPRTLSQAARDLGMAVTSLATVMEPLIAGGEVERRPHPRDRRARLLALTDAGRQRLLSAMPAFSAAYRALLDELATGGADPEGIYAALDQLRAGLERSVEQLADASEVMTRQA